MTDLALFLIIYLSGVIAAFVYGTRQGVVWLESLMCSVLSWIGVFLFWLCDNSR